MKPFNVISREKLPIIDFLFGFGIILVVLGHAHTEQYQHGLYTWLASFHMQLFVFISGYLFTHTNQGVLQKGWILKTYHKKALRLLFPFILFLPIKLLATKFTGGMDVSLADTLLYPIPGYSPMGYLWFLPMLFGIFLFVIPLYKILSSLPKKWSISLWLLCLAVFFVYNSYAVKIPILNIEGILYYACFFLCGIVIRTCESSMFCEKRIAIPMAIVTFAVLYAAVFWGGVDGMITALIGIAFSIFLGNSLAPARTIGVIGKYSFQIYLLHSYIIAVLFCVIKNSPIVPVGVTVGIVIPVLFCKMIAKYDNWMTRFINLGLGIRKRTIKA